MLSYILIEIDLILNVSTHLENLEKSRNFMNGQGKIRENRKSQGKCVLACMKFGQLVHRKIIEIVATRSLILRQSAPNSISAGAPPQTSLGSLQRSPDP